MLTGHLSSTVTGHTAVCVMIPFVLNIACYWMSAKVVYLLKFCIECVINLKLLS